MTEQTSGTPGGNAAGGSPGGETPSGNTGTRSFIAARSAQMQERMQQPAQDEQGEQPAGDPQQQRQQPPAAEQKIRVGDAEYSEADVQSAIAERAEAQSRKATLPASADQYRIELPADFQAPEGVSFEFNKADPMLKAAKELAHKRGIDQSTFSEMLGVYASTKMGDAIQQARMRDVNMQQLGVAGPQRVEAVATWLGARGGDSGRQMAAFIRQYPSAPIVKTMENLMRAFSNQGGADFSQSHRDQAEEAGKIPGYDNMSFVQKRAYQMAQTLNRLGPRGGGRRGE
jgi:hypothetical protein